MGNADRDHAVEASCSSRAQDEDTLDLAALTMDEATSADLRWRLESASEDVERQEMALYNVVLRTNSRGER